MMSILSEFERLVAALDRSGIDYAVCGGLALTIHGFPRATFDIDILIEPQSFENALALAAEFGFDIRGLDLSFKENAVEIRRVSKIDDAGEVLPIDFLLVTPQVVDVWETREKLDWENKDLWIVSLDGLIKMKELAGRAKDLIDLDRIRNEEG